MTDLETRLPPERVRLDFPAKSAADVLDELALLLGGQDVAVREAVRDGLAGRERVSATAVGGGIAFPHARVETLATLRLAFLRTAEPVGFGAPDGHAVDLFVALAGPAHERRGYLAMLGAVSYAFRSDGARQELRAAGSAEAVREALGRLVPSGHARTGEGP